MFPLHDICLGATRRSKPTLLFYHTIRISSAFMLSIFQEGKGNKLLIDVKISNKPYLNQESTNKYLT